MKRFVELYERLDSTDSVHAQIAALEQYFAGISAETGAWALYFLTGQSLKRFVTPRELREWAEAAIGYPSWMLEACEAHVGDWLESVSHLLGNAEASAGAPYVPFATMIETVLLPLRNLEASERRERLRALWAELDGATCHVLNKLVSGTLKIRLRISTLATALARLSGGDPDAAVLSFRLSRKWRPTPSSYRALFEATTEAEARVRPYDFAVPVAMDAETRADLEGRLGAVADWRIEWDLPGPRLQWIRIGGEVLLWTEGGELVNAAYPELVSLAAKWPRPAVLEGVVSGSGRACFVATDLLALGGEDRRGEPWEKRRALLEEFCREVSTSVAGSQGGEARETLDLFEAADPAPADADSPENIFSLSTSIESSTWEQVVAAHGRCRSQGAVGLRLQRRQAARVAEYALDGFRPVSIRWAADPYKVKAVLLYAQPGLAELSFALWRGTELALFCKTDGAAKALDSATQRRLEQWVRTHTRSKHGPVRVVEPSLVFEVSFEEIRASKRHKAGFVIERANVLGWLETIPPGEADSMDAVTALLVENENGVEI